jgi:hypothetical protein
MQDTRQPSRSTRKGKETIAHAREPFNESPGDDGSDGNSTDEYIKKLQAELAKLKAIHGIASSSQVFKERQRGEKGSQKQGARRYMHHLLELSGTDIITVVVNLKLILVRH